MRYPTAKRSKLVTNYAKVARKTDDNGLDSNEWDFIIAGGGIILELGYLIVLNLKPSRHSRMCSGFTSL